MSASSIEPWRAQKGPQLEAIRKHWVDELFYGGAVAGGKSDFLLGDFAQDVPSPWGPHWHGILFRKTYPQLEELISRSKEIYPRWFPGAEWHKTDKLWTWPNGATLKLRFLESEDDWMEYWGHQYGWIGFDELPLWANMGHYHKMKARLRSAHTIPNKRMRASGNPGGPGHAAVKAYFKIDQFPLGGQIFEEHGMKRLFIRSKLSDNKILLQNDPGYANRLHGVGSEALVRALLEGDWSVVAGAYFPEFESLTHVVAPVEIPEHWARIRCMDWGSARPFAVLWMAVSDGTLEQFPRGALIVYREWYGWNGEPNEGCRMTAPEVGAGIKDREGKERMADEVLDPAAFAHDGGPSIAERLDNGWRRADNARVGRLGAMGGWDQLRERLRGFEGKPMLYFFSTCTHIIRTLPALQHDTHRPEDVDTDSEDHAADALRYGCMSRPMIRDVPKDSPRKYETDLTLNELIKRAQQKRIAES